MNYISLLVVVCSFSACKSSKISNKYSDLEKYLHNPKYNFQYICTEFSNRGKILASRSRLLDERSYWYPASTVKLPVALMAMEKAQALGIALSDSLITWSKDGSQVLYKGTFLSYLEQLFVVSDNGAYNRLYEFCGPQLINQRLSDLGCKYSRIVHRVGEWSSHGLGGNEISPLTVVRGGILIYSSAYKEESFEVDTTVLRNTLQGKGYITTNDSLVLEPFDFSKKNYLRLKDLHDMMLALVYPDAVDAKNRWKISNSMREDVLSLMSTLPVESQFYNKDSLPDNYVKFLVIGDQADGWKSDYHIANKVGMAYGYVSDVAYIKDLKNDRSYIIAASMLANENEIFNDGIYEYDTIAYPVLARLGRWLLH